LKVLIAEDDLVSRTILKRAVEKLGHECVAASDGAEAWDLYKAHPDVEVIISDWMMPEVDGLELCARVREDQPDDGSGSYTFFVFLTALGDKEHLLEGMEAGADDYLSKPLDREELRARLKAASRVMSLYNRLARQKKELESLNLELFRQARRDPLTKLGNRLRMREDLEALHDRVGRYGHTYCVLLCDVDSFKSYNDFYGHLAGDEVLRRVARIVLETVRKGDSCYRYGGEEFLVALPEQSLENATKAAERLREAVEEAALPHEGNSPPGVVTLSVGIADLSPGENKTIDALLREADDALYRAKALGKNRVAARGPGRDERA
jgi:two-component system, cell cycle response regulator